MSRDRDRMAFPCCENPSDTAPEYGMTLRAYFAARAPAVPQPWFKPEMPPRPEPADWRLLRDEIRRDVAAVLDESLQDPATEEGRLFFADCDRVRKLGDDWDRAYVMERHMQWPWAWADALLRRE